MPDGFSTLDLLHAFLKNFFVPGRRLDFGLMAIDDILPEKLEDLPLLVSVEVLEWQINGRIGSDDHGARIMMLEGLAMLTGYSLAAVTVMTSSRVVMPSLALRKP
jgi:hypothetical protein